MTYIKFLSFQTDLDSNALASALAKGDVDLIQNALDSNKVLDPQKMTKALRQRFVV